MLPSSEYPDPGPCPQASTEYILGDGPNPHAGHVWGQGRQRREQAQAQALAQGNNAQNIPPPGRAPMNGIPPPPGRAPGGDRFQNEVDALNEAMFGPGGGQPRGGRGGRAGGAAGPAPARGARAPPNGPPPPRCCPPHGYLRRADLAHSLLSLWATSYVQ